MAKTVKDKIDFLNILLKHTIKTIPKIPDGLMEAQAERIKDEIRALKSQNIKKK